MPCADTHPDKSGKQARRATWGSVGRTRFDTSLAFCLRCSARSLKYRRSSQLTAQRLVGGDDGDRTRALSLRKLKLYHRATVAARSTNIPGNRQRDHRKQELHCRFSDRKPRCQPRFKHKRPGRDLSHWRSGAQPPAKRPLWLGVLGTRPGVGVATPQCHASWFCPTEVIRRFRCDDEPRTVGEDVELNAN